MKKANKILSLLLFVVMLSTIVMTALPVQAEAITKTATTSSATTKSTKLATPKLKSVTNAANGVTVQWNKVKGAAKYRVFRKTGNGKWQKVCDTTGLSVIDKKVKSGTKYTYTVRCVSKNGKSYTSAYNKKGLTITFLSAPVLQSAIKTGKTAVKVTWKKVPGAAKYRVFCKTNNSGWKKAADTTANSYTVKGLKSGTSYTFTVRCINKNGTSYTSGYNAKGIFAGQKHVHDYKAVYTIVHHDAEYKTVHHEAETKVVHHEAEYKTVHHDAVTKRLGIRKFCTVWMYARHAEKSLPLLTTIWMPNFVWTFLQNIKLKLIMGQTELTQEKQKFPSAHTKKVVVKVIKSPIILKSKLGTKLELLNQLGKNRFLLRKLGTRK